MKNRLALAAVLFLAGCESDNGSDFAQYYRAARQSIAGSIHSVRISRAEAAANPYASIGYRIGRGPEQMLTLATDGYDGQLWTASSHVVLLIKDGRIARSVGLPHDLASQTSGSNEPLRAPAAALTQKLATARMEDFPDMAAYAVRLTCSANTTGLQTLLILGDAHKLARVDETCSAAQLDWKFTDSYWVDPQTNLVWRSIQHIHPNSDPVTTELLRPPA